MSASESVAIVPVVPLATMFTVDLPGASAPNTPCIMLDERADRPPVRFAEHAQADEHQRHRQQDRRATRHPDGDAESIALHDDDERDRCDGDADRPTHVSGTVPMPTVAPERLRNVFDQHAQRITSAVEPGRRRACRSPATSPRTARRSW